MCIRPPAGRPFVSATSFRLQCAQPSLGEEQARTASPFKPYRPSTPQLRSGGGEHSRIMSSASTATSGELPFSDWEVEGEALEVCRHPDGTPIVLGQGSFGTVSQRN